MCPQCSTHFLVIGDPYLRGNCSSPWWTWETSLIFLAQRLQWIQAYYYFWIDCQCGRILVSLLFISRLFFCCSLAIWTPSVKLSIYRNQKLMSYWSPCRSIALAYLLGEATAINGGRSWRCHTRDLHKVQNHSLLPACCIAIWTVGWMVRTEPTIGFWAINLLWWVGTLEVCHE